MKAVPSMMQTGFKAGISLALAGFTLLGTSIAQASQVASPVSSKVQIQAKAQTVKPKIKKQRKKKGKAAAAVSASTSSSMTASANDGAASAGAANIAGSANSKSSSVSAPAAISNKTFGFTNALSISTVASLDSNEPTSYSGSYSLSLGARHNPSGVSASAKLSYSREYSYERYDGTDGSLENPSFSLSKGFKNGDHFKSSLVDSIGLSLSAALPGNRESERRTFLGSIGPNLSFSKKVGRTGLSQAFGYTRLFFEYDIRDNGVVNSPDSYRSVSSVGYNLTDELSLSAALALIHSVSFQGVGRTMQSASFSASYQAMEKLGITLGVSTDRPTLGPDGQSNLITLYDSRAASAFLDLGMSF